MCIPSVYLTANHIPPACHVIAVPPIPVSYHSCTVPALYHTLTRTACLILSSFACRAFSCIIICYLLYICIPVSYVIMGDIPSCIRGHRFASHPFIPRMCTNIVSHIFASPMCLYLLISARFSPSLHVNVCYVFPSFIVPSLIASLTAIPHMHVATSNPTHCYVHSNSSFESHSSVAASPLPNHILVILRSRHAPSLPPVRFPCLYSSLLFSCIIFPAVPFSIDPSSRLASFPLYHASAISVASHAASTREHFWLCWFIAHFRFAMSVGL